MLTIEEAMKMVGTEFTYIYSSGESIRAYVKAFDPNIGLTCETLETVTIQGYEGKFSKPNPDGTWCVVGFNFKREPESIELALRDLEEIAKTGNLDISTKDIFNKGNTSCAFM